MAIEHQIVEDKYAIYHGDCCEVMATWPDESVHLSVYSPPFGGLYHYSSSERDLSNARSYGEFFEHYEYVVRDLFRLTMPGRMTAVHCAEVPMSNTGIDHITDLPGDIIRLHEKCGFRFTARYCVWKEPLGVRNRTMAKGLMHKTIIDDSSRCNNARADYLLLFRRRGDNPVPVAHPNGLMSYAGERVVPKDLLHYRGWQGKQTQNLYSHWIWRQYASCFWDDIRMGRLLPFKAARDEQDEKHVHALQLDVIERCLILWSNPGEVVASPFMGVGSEVYAAVELGRKGIGVELKESYYSQAVRNIAEIANGVKREQEELPL